MPETAIDYLEGFPVKFENPNNPCNFCEPADYCQLAQYTDKIEFGWRGSVCSTDVVVCGDFITEACTFSNWVLSGWGHDASTTPKRVNKVTYSTQPLKQLNVITAGLWKITFTVVYLDQSSFTSLTVGAGNGTPVVVTSLGTHTVYITSTTTGDLSFTPSIDFHSAIASVSAVKTNSEYKIAIYNLSGVRVSNFLNDTGNVNDFFYLKTDWASWIAIGPGLPLDPGCYKIGVVDGCYQNQLFEQLTNPDFTGSATGWTLNANWAYSSNAICHTPGSTATVTQGFAPTVGKKYTLTTTITNRTAGGVYLTVGGATSPTYSSNASNQFTFTAVSGAALVINPENAFDGCFDTVSIFVHEDSYVVDELSECYNLKTSQPCTHLLTWNNDSDAFGVPYNQISGGLTASFRGAMVVHNPKYGDDREITKNAAGTKKMLYSDREKSWELAIEFVPEYVHDALALAISHDHFYIDGSEYILQKGEESPAWSQGFNLANVSFEVQPITYNNRNRLC